MASLAFKAAHPPGLSDVGYVDGSPGVPVRLATCGKDGKLCYRSAADPSEVFKSVDAHSDGDDPSPLTAVAVAPAGDRVAVADEQNFVKLFAYPGGGLLSVVTRFALPPRALAFSPSGTTLAAAGDDDSIKLIDAASNRVFRTLPAQPYTRGLAYDPEGAYVASAHADGTLVLWEIATGRAASTMKRVCPRLDPGACARLLPAWHPDGGSLLAVPSPDGAILLYERLSWAPAGELSGQHGDAAQLLAFSKNGLYLASTSADQSLVIWDVAARKALGKRVLPGAATSLAWHPSANELCVATEDGEVATWQGPVPAALPGPAADVDALVGVTKAGGAGASMVDNEAADGSDAGSEDDYDREDSFLAASPGAGDQPARKRRSKAARGIARGGGGRAGDYFPRGASAMDLMPPPQAAIQPGSSPLDAGRRYLSYTALGAITLRAEPDHNVIEVAFHDTALSRRRVPLLNDFFGFTLGALGEMGALYASRAAPDAPATLVYRPFEPWAANSDWAVALPAGEEPECLAAGGSFCAAATSARHLRLFSHGGLQTGVLALGGAPVALAAHAHSLAAVWHAAAPTPAGDQCIVYAAYHVPEQRLLHQGAVALSPGATLAWLGFTPDGQLATYDSAGVLRLRSPDFGGAWVPVFSSAAERKGAEHFWVFAVGGGEAQCIVCANQPAPTVPSGAARPVVSALPLRVPVVKHDDALSSLESDLLRHGLALSHACAAAAGTAGDGALDAAVHAARVEADRSAVRLFTKLVQADRQARALEVAGQLNTPAALQGAMRIAHHQRAGALADHIAALMERRMELETAAAAAEEEQEQAMRAAYYANGAAGGGGAPAVGGAAAASPPPRGVAGGGDGRMQARPSPAATGGKAAAAAAKDARPGTAAEATLENGAPTSSAAAPAPPKRKALVGNPFARKKSNKT